MPARRAPLVLIVDDDVTTVGMIDAVLSSAGFQTMGAGSIADAMKAIDGCKPDLILLDINLPDGNGLEVSRNIHNKPGVRETPILFISASDDIATKLHGFESGGVDYITKPVAAVEVLARVRTHLRLKHTYESLVELQAERLERLAGAQKAIMPSPSDLPEARFHIALKQVLKAGGDFYDVVPVGDQITDYLVADASGHDLAASFWTAALKTLVQEYALATNTPQQVLNAMNGSLVRVLPTGVFFTLAYARLNRWNGRLIIASAAHPPVIIIPRKGKAAIIPQVDGDVLGSFDDAFFGVKELTVYKGDRFVLYSDGLVETNGPVAQGIGRLTNACLARRGLPLEDMVASISTDMTATEVLKDDAVLMGIEV